MELHQLRYLLAVVDTGSFTAAATRELVSQSGVSAQIAKLERELATPLLERGRSIRLTAAGEVMVPMARDVLAGVAAIGEVAHELGQALRGRVRLGMLVGCDIPAFLDAVAAFSTEHPGVDLSLHEDDSPQLRHRVRTGELDLALLSEAVDPGSADAQTVSISDEPLAAGFPTTHRMRRRRTTLAELAAAELPVLCLPTGTGIRTALTRSCDLAGVEVPVGLDASSPATLIALAERGAGIVVLTESVLAQTRLQVRPISDADVHAGLRLAGRPTATPAARLLHDDIRAAMLRH